MHSYWDNLFALRGYKDAVYLAGVLGLAHERTRLETSSDTFARDLAASVRAAMVAGAWPNRRGTTAMFSATV